MFLKKEIKQIFANLSVDDLTVDNLGFEMFYVWANYPYMQRLEYLIEKSKLEDKKED